MAKCIRCAQTVKLSGWHSLQVGWTRGPWQTGPPHLVHSSLDERTWRIVLTKTRTSRYSSVYILAQKAKFLTPIFLQPRTKKTVCFWVGATGELTISDQQQLKWTAMISVTVLCSPAPGQIAISSVLWKSDTGSLDRFWLTPPNENKWTSQSYSNVSVTSNVATDNDKHRRSKCLNEDIMCRLRANAKHSTPIGLGRMVHETVNRNWHEDRTGW